MTFRFALALMLLATPAALAAEDRLPPPPKVEHLPPAPQGMAPAAPSGEAAAQRQMVEMPPMMVEHMLRNMRDHLEAVQEITRALALGQAGRAAQLAEQRLGMSSLDDHGARMMAPMMPEGMRDYGTALHQSASRLARAITDADVRDDAQSRRDLWQAFDDMLGTCTGCHAGYRVR